MFHVPEKHRVSFAHGEHWDASAGNNGHFEIPPKVNAKPSHTLFCVASDGAGWEHVSFSIKGLSHKITPTWPEVCRVKETFWDDEDVVVQFHPRKSEYVNNVVGVLHLWRPIGIVLPTPSSILVGRLGEDQRDTAERMASGALHEGIDYDVAVAESHRRVIESLDAGQFAAVAQAVDARRKATAERIAELKKAPYHPVCNPYGLNPDEFGGSDYP